MFCFTAGAGLAQTENPSRPKVSRKQLPSLNFAKTSPAAERQEVLKGAVQLANEEYRELRAEQPATAPAQAEQPKSEPPQTTPGNDIYRWVDARGVIHYSTNVPPALKGVATKVGASRSSP